MVIHKKINVNKEVFFKWAKFHNLYEKTHKKSRFLSLYEEDIIPDGDISVSYHEINGHPVSLMIFEHFSKDSLLNNSNEFTSHKRKLTCGSIGRLGLYVHPDYRKRGLAKELVGDFIPNLLSFEEDLDKDFNYVGASSIAHQILWKFLPLNTTQCVQNKAVWLQTAKQEARNGTTSLKMKKTYDIFHN